jgi:hypothetical protein
MSQTTVMCMLYIKTITMLFPESCCWLMILDVGEVGKVAGRRQYWHFHSEKKFLSLPQSIASKCGDKQAPVATFVANTFLPLDTDGLMCLKASPYRYDFSMRNCLEFSIPDVKSLLFRHFSINSIFLFTPYYLSKPVVSNRISLLFTFVGTERPE